MKTDVIKISFLIYLSKTKLSLPRSYFIMMTWSDMIGEK
jgi:hypothetical protein